MLLPIASAAVTAPFIFHTFLRAELTYQRLRNFLADFYSKTRLRSLAPLETPLYYTRRETGI